MGFDFSSDSGAELQLTGSGWTFFLNLASQYAWTRKGTLPPPGLNPGDWPGNYDSNEGQRVQADDAKALAAALLRALADPTRETVTAQVAAAIADAVRRETGRVYSMVLTKDTWTTMQELATFCSQGSFTVD